MNTLNNKPLTFVEAANWLREELETLARQHFGGRDVSRTVTVWEDGRVVTKVLSGEELLEKMSRLAGDLVWEESRRQVLHPLAQPQLALA